MRVRRSHAPRVGIGGCLRKNLVVNRIVVNQINRFGKSKVTISRGTNPTLFVPRRGRLSYYLQNGNAIPGWGSDVLASGAGGVGRQLGAVGFPAACVLPSGPFALGLRFSGRACKVECGTKRCGDRGFRRSNAARGQTVSESEDDCCPGSAKSFVGETTVDWVGPFALRASACRR